MDEDKDYTAFTTALENFRAKTQSHLTDSIQKELMDWNYDSFECGWDACCEYFSTQLARQDALLDEAKSMISQLAFRLNEDRYPELDKNAYALFAKIDDAVNHALTSRNHSEGETEIAVKISNELWPSEYDVSLALKMSRYIHDNCENVPHDIGIHLAKMVWKKYGDGVNGASSLIEDENKETCDD